MWKKCVFPRVRRLFSVRGVSPITLTPYRPSLSERASNCASNHIGVYSVRVIGDRFFSRQTRVGYEKMVKMAGKSLVAPSPLNFSYPNGTHFRRGRPRAFRLWVPGTPHPPPKNFKFSKKKFFFIKSAKTCFNHDFDVSGRGGGIFRVGGRANFAVKWQISSRSCLFEISHWLRWFGYLRVNLCKMNDWMNERVNDVDCHELRWICGELDVCIWLCWMLKKSWFFL